MDKIEKYAVIVAGGTGSRLGGGLPKQFRLLNGRPMVWWSMKAFVEADSSTHIILVVHPDYIESWKKLFDSLPESDRIRHEVIGGGESRTASVMNGISGIVSDDSVLIAVHDAARPLVTTDMILRGWKVGSQHGVAVPVVPVTDSLRRLSPAGNVAVDRSEYVAVQTPQVFRSSVLKSAYAGMPGKVFSDDASATEVAGWSTFLYDGAPENMKVTNPGDLEIASARLAASGQKG